MGNVILADPIPGVPGLGEYFVGFKALLDHPVMPYDAVVGKSVVLQSSDRHQRFVLTFMFPADAEYFEQFIVPLIRVFRISPFINFHNVDIARQVGSDKSNTILVGLEELRVDVEPSRNMATVSLTVIPVAPSTVGGLLKYRVKRGNQWVGTLFPAEDSLFSKAVRLRASWSPSRETTLKFKSSSKIFAEEIRAKVRTEWQDLDVREVLNLFENEVVLQPVQDKSVLLRNLIAVQPIAGLSLPAAQYMGYGGAQFRLRLKSHLDDPTLKKLMDLLKASLDILLFKMNPLESLEALEVTDDLLKAISAAESRTNKLNMVCTRITGGTVPGESGWYEYELYFLEQDLRFLAKSKHVKRLGGAPLEDLQLFMEKMGKRLGELDVAQWMLPVTSGRSFTVNYPMVILSRATAIAFVAEYFTDSTDPAIDDRIRFARPTEKAGAHWFDRVWPTFREAFRIRADDYVNPDIREDFLDAVWNMLTGHTNIGYSNLVELIARHYTKIKPKFWRDLAEVLAHRRGIDATLRVYPDFDLKELNSSFNLLYNTWKLQHTEPDKKVYGLDLWKELPLPTYAELGISDQDIPNLLGDAAIHGTGATAADKVVKATDKVGPAIFFEIPVKKKVINRQLDNYVARLREATRGLVFDTTLHSLSEDEVNTLLKLSGVTNVQADQLPDSIVNKIIRELRDKQRSWRIVSLLNAAKANDIEAGKRREIKAKLLDKINSGQIDVRLTFRVKATTVSVHLRKAVGAKVVKRVVALDQQFWNSDEVIGDTYWKSAIGALGGTQRFDFEAIKDSLAAKQNYWFPRTEATPLRLFPVVRVYLATTVGRGIFRTWDYTELSSIMSIRLTTSKEDPALAVISIVDPYSLVADFLAPKRSSFHHEKQEAKEWVYPLSYEDLVASITGGKSIVGSWVVIYGGYGAHFGQLELLFSGRITEYNPGPPVNLVAQGWKAELLNRAVHFYTEADDDLPLHAHVVRLIQTANPQGAFGEHIPQADAEVMLGYAEKRQWSSAAVLQARLSARGIYTRDVSAPGEEGLDLRVMNIFYPPPSPSVTGALKTILDIIHLVHDPTTKWVVPYQPLWRALQESARHGWKVVCDVRPTDYGATIYWGPPEGWYYDQLALGKKISQEFSGLVKSVWDNGSDWKKHQITVSDDVRKLYGQSLPTEWDLTNVDVIDSLRWAIVGLSGVRGEALAWAWASEDARSKAEKAGRAIRSIERQLRPFAEALRRLKVIPAVWLKEMLNYLLEVGLIDARKVTISRCYEYLSSSYSTRSGETTCDLNSLDDKAVIAFLRELMEADVTRREFEWNLPGGFYEPPRIRIKLAIPAGQLALLLYRWYQRVKQRTAFSGAEMGRPFRRHRVINHTTLIVNGIEATEREMANAIRVRYPGEEIYGMLTRIFTDRHEDFTMLPPDTEWKTFPPLAGQSAVPVLQGEALSWHPSSLDVALLLKDVVELNAHDAATACKLAIVNLAREMRKMYRGKIVTTGSFFMPWDICGIHDWQNNMKGYIEVDRVVHEYDPRKGWVSTITPHLITQPNDATTLITLAAFDDVVEYGLEIIDIAFDVWMVISVLTTLLTGGTGGGLVAVGKAARKAIEKGLLKSAAGLIGRVAWSTAKMPGLALKTLLGLFSKKFRGKAAIGMARTITWTFGTEAVRKALATSTTETGIKLMIEELGKLKGKVWTKEFATLAAQSAIEDVLLKVVQKTMVSEAFETVGFLVAPLIFGRSLSTLPVNAMPLVKDGVPYVAGLSSSPLLYSFGSLSYSFSKFIDNIYLWYANLADWFRGPTPNKFPTPSSTPKSTGGSK